jgi:hypothetical protein
MHAGRTNKRGSEAGSRISSHHLLGPKRTVVTVRLLVWLRTQFAAAVAPKLREGVQGFWDPYEEMQRTKQKKHMTSSKLNSARRQKNKLSEPNLCAPAVRMMDEI